MRHDEADDNVGDATQPAAAALLHLMCDVSAELEPLLSDWWERFHHRELLSLDGFLSARRARLVGSSENAQILVLYGLSDPAAADQPRPPDFKQMPAALDGKVTFNRRILRRVSQRTGQDPVGPTVLQLLRSSADCAPDAVRARAERVAQWPEVIGATAWRSAGVDSPAGRSEVVHLADTEVILAELAEIPYESGTSRSLVARAADELPGWVVSVYRQAFPAVGVLVPSATHGAARRP